MKLDDLLLTKQELPLLYENCFSVPIHPKLLQEDLRIDPDLAHDVFQQVADEWYDDLQNYKQTIELDEEKKEWYDEVFLKKRPKVEKENGKQILDTLLWEDDVTLMDNGFARVLSISRNAGGTLYFNNREGEHQTPISIGGKGMIRFSEGKAREFAIEEKILGNGIKCFILNVYFGHNIDYSPGALFLRNWAMLYQNEALKQVS